jgi:hypothetical protein
MQAWSGRREYTSFNNKNAPASQLRPNSFPATPIRCRQALACCAFFLRQPSRPKAPRPVAKSGSAPGRGTAGNGSTLPVTT